jgi:hypothetical protein
MEFRPNMIFDLGRGYGNSTCIFTEAANRLDQTRVLSLCLSDDWQKRTMPRLAKLVPSEWSSKLDARITNILDVDLMPFVNECQRVLIFWDIHGWDVAEYVLGAVVPALLKKPHIILVHDITYSAGYPPELRSYKGHGIWRGYRGGADPDYVFVGSMSSPFEELIALADFSARNQVPIHSVEKEIREEIESWPDRQDEMTSRLGDKMSSPVSSIHWFTMNDLLDDAVVTFPRFRKAPSNGLSRLPAMARHLTRDL